MEEAMNLVCASDLFRDVAENTWYHEAWTTWCARAIWTVWEEASLA